MKTNDELFDLIIQIRADLAASNARIEQHLAMDKLLFEQHRADIDVLQNQATENTAERLRNTGTKNTWKFVASLAIACIPTSVYAAFSHWFLK